MVFSGLKYISVLTNVRIRYQTKPVPDMHDTYQK